MLWPGTVKYGKGARHSPADSRQEARVSLDDDLLSVSPLKRPASTSCELPSSPLSLFDTQGERAELGACDSPQIATILDDVDQGGFTAGTVVTGTHMTQNGSPSPPKVRMTDRMEPRRPSSGSSTPAKGVSPRSSPARSMPHSQSASSLNASQRPVARTIDAEIDTCEPTLRAAERESPYKRTYGRDRKILNVADNIPQAVESRNPGSTGHLRESYANFKRRIGTEDIAGLEARDDSDKQSVVNTLVQLKSQGEAQQFHDEMGYLLDGLRNEAPVTLRRTSAVELCENFSMDGFVFKVVALGELDAVCDALTAAFSAGTDGVVNLVLAFLLASVASDRRTIQSLTERHVQLMGHMMRSHQDAEMDSKDSAAEQTSGRSARQAVASVDDIIRNSPLGSNKHQRSAGALAFMALAMVVEQRPRPAFKPVTLFFQYGIVRQAINCLVTMTEESSACLSAFPTGWASVQLSQKSQMRDLPSCLRIIEAASSAIEEVIEELDLVPFDANKFAALISVLHIVACADTDLATIGMDCLLSLLRILITLCGASPSFSLSLLDEPHEILHAMVRLLASAGRQLPGTDLHDNLKPLESADGRAAELAFDIICLSVGLITHLLEASSQASDALRQTRINVECAASRHCTLQCLCPTRCSALHLITSFYLAHTANSDPRATSENASFLRNYLTVLLAMVCLSNPTNEALVLEDIKTQSSARHWLKQTIHELLKVQEDARSAGLPGDQDVIDKARRLVERLSS